MNKTIQEINADLVDLRTHGEMMFNKNGAKSYLVIPDIKKSLVEEAANFHRKKMNEPTFETPHHYFMIQYPWGNISVQSKECFAKTTVYELKEEGV